MILLSADVTPVAKRESLEAGADLRVVQELLRHRSITSTTRYTAVRPGRLRAAVARLDYAA